MYPKFKYELPFQSQLMVHKSWFWHQVLVHPKQNEREHDYTTKANFCTLQPSLVAVTYELSILYTKTMDVGVSMCLCINLHLSVPERLHNGWFTNNLVHLVSLKSKCAICKFPSCMSKVKVTIGLDKLSLDKLLVLLIELPETSHIFKISLWFRINRNS